MMMTVPRRDTCFPNVTLPDTAGKAGDLGPEWTIRDGYIYTRVGDSIAPAKLDPELVAKYGPNGTLAELLPAAFGGPSTPSVSADDAIWEPINGISLQHYAELAREAQTRGVTDEAGMIAIAQERGRAIVLAALARCFAV